MRPYPDMLTDPPPFAPARDPAEVTRRAHAARGRRIGRAARRLFGLVSVAAALALGVRVLVAEPVTIPSGSMAPTLLPGDTVLVDKAAYGWSLASLPAPLLRLLAARVAVGEASPESAAPVARLGSRAAERGDVVLFVADPALGIDHVKRVVAVGGDRVAIRGGQLWLDGAPVPCEPVAPGLCRERIGTRAWTVRIGPAGPDMPETRVPEGHYFVLGDNRADSADSRAQPGAGGVGMVPHGRLAGRAERVLPSAGGKPDGRRIGSIE